MNHRTIRDTAILIGFNSAGVCVYSAHLPLGNYWGSEHVWDSDIETKNLQMTKVKGFLFDENGDLFDEFETSFDETTGLYRSGWTKRSDGTIEEHKA